jgi:hypothetical protein
VTSNLLLLLLLLLAQRLISLREAAGFLAGDLEGAEAFGGEFWGDLGEELAVDFDFDGFGGFAAIDAFVGGNVAVIPADGDFDEVGADDAFVGGVETDPAD